LYFIVVALSFRTSGNNRF